MTSNEPIRLYGYLADAVVTLHVAYVAFVVVGQLVILTGAVCRWRWVRNLWFRLFHLLAIGVVVFEAAMNYRCPLTTLEQSLLAAGGLPTDERTFVGRMLNNLLFYDAPQEAFAPAYFAFGAIVLLSFILAPPRCAAGAPPPAAPTRFSSWSHKDCLPNLFDPFFCAVMR